MLAAQARVRAGLPPLDQPLPPLEPDRLARGEPLAGLDDFLFCRGLDLGGYLLQASREILPALGQGLPALAPGLDLLQEALADPAGDGPECLAAILAGRPEVAASWAERTGLAPAALAFGFTQLAKPLLERRSQYLASLLDGHAWEHGFCPVCGSLPELGILQGEGGQRWLRCSLCAHHWRFTRTACPVCGNQDQDKLEFFFVKGREHERADCCRQCGKYLLSLDARGLAEAPLWEAAALAMTHLDLLAQERGLAPAVWTAWNQVR